jgi:hypothetical protein
MKIIIIILIFSFNLFSYEKDYLIRISDEDPFYQMGVPCGMVNMIGDTIIPIGKYPVIFTDTLKYFAIVIDKDKRMIAIDKNENELFEVQVNDNGPDYIECGLFRIIIDGKTGYANEKGEIIIKPLYDCATPFYEGIARVVFNCELKSDGTYKYNSDEEFHIDTLGKKIE